ncbi:speckle-type POZ protein B-like isoform X2 [Chrysoperla carnea]|nr:speckle-type POZ protein B-like isoform X2 [Chrysoperla carnea]XP_044740344.1 speckle-type POZ protein B-like isoform X2 [Chrysoperla carnea]
MSPGSKTNEKHKDVTTANQNLDGNISCELQVPTVSDVVFKYTWKIRKFKRSRSKKDMLDSPIFECAVNGITTKWVIGIRSWQGPNGKRIANPVCVCVSLVSCSLSNGIGGSGQSTTKGSVESIPGSTVGEQARVRFQLGVLDAGIRHWEFYPVNRVALQLANSANMLSVGYRDMRLEDRHIDKDGDLSIMLKLQLVPTEVERHTLSQDLGRLLEHNEVTDTIIKCSNGTKKTDDSFKVHSSILKARSSMLAAMLKEYNPSDTCSNNNSTTSSSSTDSSATDTLKYQLDLSELSEDIVHELIRYIYTDKVENLDTHAPKLLSLAHRFYLDGLTELCERSLVETLTPSNVGNVLLLADQCNCEPLKRAALAYCEENVSHTGDDQIGKSLAWRVMELVNPNLFYEACEAGMGSSHSSNLDSQGSRSDDQM